MDAANQLVDEPYDATLMVRVSSRQAALYREAARADGYRKLAPWIREKLEEIASVKRSRKRK